MGIKQIFPREINIGKKKSLKFIFYEILILETRKIIEKTDFQQFCLVFNFINKGKCNTYIHNPDKTNFQSFALFFI